MPQNPKHILNESLANSPSPNASSSTASPTSSPPAQPLLLASESKYRRELLGRLGVPFAFHKPLFDEESAKSHSTNPTELALFLAQQKALSLQQKFPTYHILGGDQLVHFNGQILGKPLSIEKAIDQLVKMSGQVHELVTAVAILNAQFGQVSAQVSCQFETHLHTTRLKMKNLSRSEITDYVHLDLPLDCAGSYKIEKAGIALFDQVETSDFTAIMGLPLMAVSTMLKNLGFHLFQSDSKHRLFDVAKQFQNKAHSPYSKANIAAAVLFENGEIFGGVNIENASYGGTVCAERVAIWKGISELGKSEVREILVLSDAEPPWPPCGMCRQVLAEFSTPQTKIHIANTNGIEKTILMDQLFPFGFTSDFLAK